MKEAYGENSLPCGCVFKWYERFCEGWKSTEDDQCPGWPVNVSTLQTVTKINTILHKDCRMSIRMIVETVNADKETVKKLLHDKLNMKKICAKLFLTNLTPGQKLFHQQICSDLLERLDEEPELKENFITCDKMGCFNVMLKVSGNSCIGKLLHCQEGKKQGYWNQNI